MSKPHETFEIVSLNAADLDIEELEQRLEMAAAGETCWEYVCTEFNYVPPEDLEDDK